MNYKNRKPKKYKGCCRMCALGDSNGCRNGRRQTRQEVASQIELNEYLSDQQYLNSIACESLGAQE